MSISTQPLNGRLNANQNSASAVSAVDSASHSPRSKTSRTIGSASTAIAAPAGISSRPIWRMPVPIVARMPA